MASHPHVPAGILLGRACIRGFDHPRIVTVRDDMLVDITAPGLATVHDIIECENCASLVAQAPGTGVGPLGAVLGNALSAERAPISLYAPIDLQAIKAAGVTFAASLLERVIEEQARGDQDLAYQLRLDIQALIGNELTNLVPGSPEAMEIRRVLILRGMWSQYLEVGIGADAEVFTKAQPMSAVGYGADVGLHPMSSWNNPEPEIVLAVASSGRIAGATLGNDVNLRDVEGRSALLLGKAKDNNASTAIGPFIRLFDDEFTLDTIRAAEVFLRIEGTDGFVLTGQSSMKFISRQPEDLVAQTIGSHHQYPDGLVLFLGTMFAPVEDRDAPGKGFTHKPDDVVSISSPDLGTLINRVRLSTECPPWTYGASHLMRDLARNRLI